MKRINNEQITTTTVARQKKPKNMMSTTDTATMNKRTATTTTTTAGEQLAMKRQNDWMTMYQRLVTYKANNNGCTKVPLNYLADKQLGVWVKLQRFNKNKNSLVPKRQELLDAIDFDWGEGKNLPWNIMFDRLVTYKANNNGCINVKCSADKVLHDWLNKQRYNHRKNKLPQHRVESLDSIGFHWGEGEEKRWMKMYQCLITYKASNSGSTQVPFKYPDDETLARWVSKQRYNRWKNKLPQHRVELLDLIGFHWGKGPKTTITVATPDMRTDTAMTNKGPKTTITVATPDMRTDTAMINKGPKTTVTVATPDMRTDTAKMKKRTATTTGGEQLAMKRQNERKHYSSVKFDEAWMTMYQRLVKYADNHNGSTKVPQNYIADKKLGKWVSKQRARKNSLSPGRRTLLDKIYFDMTGGGQFPIIKGIVSKKRGQDMTVDNNVKKKQRKHYSSVKFDDAWMTMYQRLVTYKANNNGCTKVPRNYPNDKKLGNWVATQRERREGFTCTQTAGVFRRN